MQHNLVSVNSAGTHACPGLDTRCNKSKRSTHLPDGLSNVRSRGVVVLSLALRRRALRPHVPPSMKNLVWLCCFSPWWLCCLVYMLTWRSVAVAYRDPLPLCEAEGRGRQCRKHFGGTLHALAPACRQYHPSTKVTPNHVAIIPSVWSATGCEITTYSGRGDKEHQQ